MDAVVDRLRLALGVARADERSSPCSETPRRSSSTTSIAFLSAARRTISREQRLARLIALASPLARARRGRARRCSRRQPGRRAPRSAAPAAARSRTIEEETSSSGESRKRAAPAPATPAARAHRGAHALRGRSAGRAATATSASSQQPPRLAPGGQRAAMSAPTMNVSSACGWLAWMASRYPRYRTVRRVRSRACNRDVVDPRDEQPAHRQPVPGPGPARPACAAAARAASADARRASSRAARARASARCPRCGGLNVPPRMPSAHERPARDAGSGANVAVALDEVLVRAELAQADRPARVQLLRRVADLRAHPELATVGEARRGVHVDARRVDTELEVHARRPCRASRSPPSGRCRIGRCARSPARPSPRRRSRSSSPRYSVAQSSSLAACTSAASLPGESASARSSARTSTPASPQRRRRSAARTRSATSRWTSSFSAALQTPGRCSFALSTIASACSRSALAST